MSTNSIEIIVQFLGNIIVVEAFLSVLDEQENKQGSLEEVKASGTSERRNLSVGVAAGKG